MSKVSTRVVTHLRRAISEGTLQPGERVGEEQVADDLGVSRTPVRLAFRSLEQEGLLQRAGKRGFEVRAFTEADVLAGLEVRGLLEGLAARRLAEAGVTADTRAMLEECLADGDAILAKGRLEPGDVDVWRKLNARFHNCIVTAAGSMVIAEAISRNNHLPFASFDSLIIDNTALDREFKKLQLANWQHHMVVQALLAGEGARAESLMREHANVGVRYAALFGLNTAGSGR